MGYFRNTQIFTAVTTVMIVAILVLPMPVAFADSAGSTMGVSDNTVNADYFSADLYKKDGEVYTRTSVTSLISSSITLDPSETTVSGDHTLSASEIYLMIEKSARMSDSFTVSDPVLVLKDDGSPIEGIDLALTVGDGRTYTYTIDPGTHAGSGSWSTGDLTLTSGVYYPMSFEADFGTGYTIVNTDRYFEAEVSLAVTRSGGTSSGSYGEQNTCTLATSSIIDEIIAGNDGEVVGDLGDVTDTNDIYSAQDPSEITGENHRDYISNDEQYEAANIVGNTHGGIAKQGEDGKFYADVTVTLPQIPFCVSVMSKAGNGDLKVTVTYDYGLGGSNPSYSSGRLSVAGGGAKSTWFVGLNGGSVMTPTFFDSIVNFSYWFPVNAPGYDTAPTAITVHVYNWNDDKAVNEGIGLDFIFDSHTPVSSP